MFYTGIIGQDIKASNITDINDITLQSEGGSLFEGLAIYDTFIGKIETIKAVGVVASAATLFLLTAKNRIGTENSRYILHNPYGGSFGESKDLQKSADEMLAEENNLIRIYANHLNISVEEIKSLMAKNTIINAEESLRIGLITEIQKNTNMQTKENTEKVNEFMNFIDKVLNFINGTKIQNFVKQDVNGIAIDFGDSAKSIDEVKIGSKATVNGAPAQGEFTLEDGTVWKFDNGTLTEIATKQAESTEVETMPVARHTEIINLKDVEIQNLKVEIESKQVEIQNLQNFKVKAEADVLKLKNEFENFKGTFNKSNIENPVMPPLAAQGNKENSVKKLIFKNNKN